MRKRQEKKAGDDPSDFPIAFEDELEPEATYCMECGKVHRTGECQDVNE